MNSYSKGKQNILKFALFLAILVGGYLIVAWASYSPLDNAWSIASSATHTVLNKTGYLGAYLIDLLQSMFGRVAFIFPFALTFTSSYVLIMRQIESLTWKSVMLWLTSLFVLMCGLAGLASVLLSNSLYYLSGGFIGGGLTALLEDSVGQFGVLFIAMVFASLGFYFCSGQLLWQLSQRFYHWLTEIKEPSAHEEESQRSEDLQKSAEIAPLETDLPVFETAEQTHQTTLTDPSIFTRPKITGLKTAETLTESAPIMHSEVQENFTDVTKFNIENHFPLPKIILEEEEHQNPVPVSDMTQMEIEPREVSEQAMPRVRLNTDNTHSIQHHTKPKDEPISINVAGEVAQAEPVQVNIENQNDIQPPFLQNLGQNIPPDVLSDAVDTKPPKNPYPKGGYGNSLIHPLLQRETVAEKPTTPLPAFDLLNPSPACTQKITEQEIRETSVRIEQELANFGIKATVEDVLVGPVVTRYEIQPAAGVKAAKIAALGSDLARALIFKAIRITDAVPGKPYIGIEAPNRERETVWLRDVLESQAFRHSDAILPMALGKDISGQPIIVDMAKMPHLLVAGQTGGGKSVGVNTMILSLLFKLSPDQVRFIMIDPKVVELSVYNDIPHLLTPVVTDMKKAENALRWAVEEMERRYLLLSSVNVRNIEGYNSLIKKADEEMGMPIPNPLWKPGDTMDQMPPPLEKMSYIVLVVDEFADLMMSAGKQVEDHIMRIAQKARAVGIHLILATQRPSTDVITGVIKANIPSRIAFTVASQIDSRTILDKGGAESLLGRGDMLYAPNGSPELIRIHGAFMTDEEVNRVAENWRARGKPDYIENITASNESEGSHIEEKDNGDLDPLFDEIVQFVMDTEITSISGIQRRFKIGFTRAGRIVDQLEAEGILSAVDSRGKRQILAR